MTLKCTFNVYKSESRLRCSSGFHYASAVTFFDAGIKHSLPAGTLTQSEAHIHHFSVSITCLNHEPGVDLLLRSRIQNIWYCPCLRLCACFSIRRLSFALGSHYQAKIIIFTVFPKYLHQTKRSMILIKRMLIKGAYLSHWVTEHTPRSSKTHK